MRLFLSPSKVTGGIARVIEAQQEYFASSIVETVLEADTVGIHAGSIPRRLTNSQHIVAHCHGFLWNKYDWGGQESINELVTEANHIADKITAPTEWVADAIRRATNRPVSVIPHGIDMNEWQPGKNNKHYVLWNKSRVDRVCDPQPVYQVAKLLPDVQFRMTVGKQTSKNITITGLTPYEEKAPVQEAGVYLATAQETFGIGILESLACGVPVVGWDWGGQSSILPSSWLAPEGDIKRLAELIEWALNTDLRDQCLEIAVRYPWSAAMKLYEQAYEPIHYTKRISVVIRNYNLREYLPNCIESVLPQLTNQDECIVVDDCSTDDSLEVIKDYPEVKVVKTEKNIHLAGALNAAMMFTSGKYILHIDADNAIMPDTLDVLSEALDQDRHIDIAYGNVKWEPPQRTTWPPAVFSAKDQLDHKNQIPCTAMYRSKVYEATGPYRFRCRVAEDADFWCRAVRLGFIPKHVTDSQTLVYRVRPGTTSQQTPDWDWHKWYPTEHNGAYDNTPAIVSVIIPVGPGHELYLQDALDSVWAQTFRNWECIVVNDTGYDIWTPRWVKLATTTGKTGTSNARNEGLSIASGPLWASLDADDYYTDKNALLKLIKAWQQNRHCYVYTDYIRNGGNVEKTPDKVCDIIKQKMPHTMTGLYPNLPNIRFKDRIAEDWDYVLQLTKLGYCGVRVPEALSYYRIESGSRRRLATPEVLKQVQDEWKDVEFMCGCTNTQQTQQQVIPGDMILLRYLGSEPKRYFIGQVTGRTYAFGSLPEMQEKYVFASDAPGFLSRVDRFVLTGNMASNPPPD